MGRLILVFGSLLLCCAAPSTDPSPAACGDSDAIVAVSDYASSGVGAVALDGGAALSFGVDLGKDPALAVSRGRAFFVARQEGTIFELDPRCGRAQTKFLVNDPRHAGSANPQDVAAAPDGTLWVPRYNVPSIAIVQADGSVASLDLSAYDEDGNPQTSAIRVVDIGGAAKAFVALERLDDLSVPPLRSTRPSMMLRIDVATRAIESATELAGRNPFNTMIEQNGAFFLAEPGNFDTKDEVEAGIERFDTPTSQTRILVRETDLGGSVVEVAVSGKCGVAIVADPTPTVNATSLATFPSETGVVLARNVIGPSEDFEHGLRGLAWTSGGKVLLVGDRRREAQGFPIHQLERDDACNLHARADAIFVSQKPVSVRSVAN